MAQYKVLFASPSDLREERERFPYIVDELNRVWGKILGFQIIPLMYEYSSAPGISTHSAQSLISEDFGSDYDVFIGAYWQKYGTPTLDAHSGTEEEFNNAYKRFCEDHSSVQILFYFKEMPPATLSEINLDELSKIRAFKTTLEQKNILYWTFTDLASFEKCIREHLPLRLLDKGPQKALSEKPFQKHISETIAKTEIGEISAEEDSEVIEAEELGILDYRDEFDRATQSVITCLQNLSFQTTDYGKLLNKATRQLNRERSKSVPLIKNIRAICLSVVAGTDKLSENYEVNIPKYLDNFKIAIEMMAKIKGICPDNENNLEDVKEISLLSENIQQTKKSITEFRTVVANGAILIKEQKPANKRLLRNLDNFINACTAGLELIDQLLISLN